MYLKGLSQFIAQKDKAVVRFADWLTTLTVEREVETGLGAGKAKIVLCGHRYVFSILKNGFTPCSFNQHGRAARC